MSRRFWVPARTLANPIARSVLEYPFVLEGRLLQAAGGPSGDALVTRVALQALPVVRDGHCQLAVLLVRDAAVVEGAGTRRVGLQHLQSSKAPGGITGRVRAWAG